MSLTKEQILECAHVYVEPLTVPDLGDVFIRAMSGIEYDTIEKLTETKQTTNWRARIAAVSLSDEDGKRLFKDGDISKLATTLTHRALDAIADKALIINRVNDVDVDNLEGN